MALRGVARAESYSVFKERDRALDNGQHGSPIYRRALRENDYWRAAQAGKSRLAAQLR